VCSNETDSSIVMGEGVEALQHEVYWEVLALNKGWRIRETLFFEIASSYTNMIPIMIPFFPSIPYVILKKYVSHFRVFLVFPLLIQSDILLH